MSLLWQWYLESEGRTTLEVEGESRSTNNTVVLKDKRPKLLKIQKYGCFINTVIVFEQLYFLKLIK